MTHLLLQLLQLMVKESYKWVSKGGTFSSVFFFLFFSDRTIILSTHHLDEAEVLSDRIAFLERGGLKCCGSPFYLKDKLGQGYKLTLTKKVIILTDVQSCRCKAMKT